MARYTPGFLAAVRHRYEDTDQPMRLIAAEFKIGISTLQSLVQKEGWAKRSQRTRDLRPASRLIDDVIALTASPAPQSAAPECGAALAATEPDEIANRIPLHVEAEDPPAPAETAASAASAIERIEAFLLRQLSAEEAAHERQGAAPREPGESERSARTMSILIRALHSLRELRGDFSNSETIDSNDDMPQDIDAFRRDLARRIDAFVASRTDLGDADGNSGPAPLAEAR